MFFLIFFQFKAQACSEALVPYPNECRDQDHYQRLMDGFRLYSLEMANLKGFKIPKALGDQIYFAEKNELLNHSEKALSQSVAWHKWLSAQQFIKDLNTVFLDLSDITKLHKAIFSKEKNSSVEAGKLRTHNGISNPKKDISCQDEILSEETLNLLLNYDLKSSEGYSLLKIQNIKTCPNKLYVSADVFFYKGASVKFELNRWLIEFNDFLYRYENQSAPLDYGPYMFISDMRRWFMAIGPFLHGNEEVIAALIDYATIRLGLVPLSFNEKNLPIFKSAVENQKETSQKARETLSFFEGCLFEIKTKLVSSECSGI